MNITELSGDIMKTACEDCGKETVCYEQGHITPITRQLAYEKWLCSECVY